MGLTSTQIYYAPRLRGIQKLVEQSLSFLKESRNEFNINSILYRKKYLEIGYIKPIEITKFCTKFCNFDKLKKATKVSL